MRVLTGEELLRANYPAIYQVGAGSARQPRLIDLTWGDQAAKKVTLVGKGVVFDTGGYDLKPSSAMRLMKKDMGGAAITLGLASVLMAMKLPIRLRLLIPAVENSVSGTAMRPGDVIRTRAGKTVEVGNTDAEGRLILADALTEAAAEAPARLQEPDGPWASALTGGQSPYDPLYPYVRTRGIRSRKAFAKQWQELSAAYERSRQQLEARRQAPAVQRWDLSRTGDVEQWYRHGNGLPDAKPQAAGSYEVTQGGGMIVADGVESWRTRKERQEVHS